jgi:hypothetical protein
MAITTEVQEVPRHVHNGSDSPQIPQENIDGPINDITADQVAALAGSSGSPSSTNTYITEDDVKDDGTASKIVRLDANSQATIAETPTADAHAASKVYVDGQQGYLSYATASDTTQLRSQTEVNLGPYGDSNNKEFITYVPGKVRLKMRMKTASPTVNAEIVIADLDDSKYLTNDSLVPLRIAVTTTSYTYYETDIYVSPGMKIVLSGSSVFIEDFQVNFTVNTTNDTYGALI